MSVEKVELFKTFYYKGFRINYYTFLFLRLTHLSNILSFQNTLQLFLSEVKENLAFQKSCLN